MELGLVLSILKEGLQLANTLESGKWLDRVISLEKDYYEEISKSDSIRSDFRIDTIMLELETIGKAFSKHQAK